MSLELERTSKGSSACVAAQRGLLFHKLSRGGVRKCELWQRLSPTGHAYKSAGGEAAELRVKFLCFHAVYSQHLRPPKRPQIREERERLLFRGLSESPRLPINALAPFLF